MENNTLHSINADYILEIEVLNNEKTKQYLNKITKELVDHAQKIVDMGYVDYLKNPNHEQGAHIKAACLHYYLAIYLLVSSGSVINSVGVKASLKKLIAEHNHVGDLLKDLLNFDFYMGGCGIEAQNLAIKSKIK